jgi:radical SAM superfamily enzyme YgiQ (UPF0313 family)
VNVLLINPPWQTKDGNIWHGVKGTSPPLGLLYVASHAESHGHNVRVIDVDAEQLSLDDIADAAKQDQPDWVGITAVTKQITAAKLAAEQIRKVSPRSKIVVGGIHATAMPEELLRDENFDYVIRGEGEVPFTALLDGEPVDSIGGLSYRGNNPLQPYQHNDMAEPIENLDALPTPAYHLLPFEAYKPAIGAYRRLPSVNMTMTRGCPGKCTFCNSAETALRTRSAEHLVDEIQQLQATYGIREVSFYDDTFTIYKQNVIQLCDLIIERGIDLTWSCFARTDCVSPGLLKKMKAAGCHQILFGLESADPGILESIRKPIDIDLTRKAVRMVQDARIDVRAAFMFGNPGETIETMQRTIDFAVSLDPDICIFNITTPYPGTQMFDWAHKNGYLKTLDWADYDLANAVMELPTVTRDDINMMYRAAYREFYFRPRYLLKRFLRIRTWEDVKVHYYAFRSVFVTRTTGRRNVGKLINKTAVPRNETPGAAAAAC